MVLDNGEYMGGGGGEDLGLKGESPHRVIVLGSESRITDN